MNATRMINCGVCERTHEDIVSADCRSFKICPKCGDGYLTIGYGPQQVDHYAAHILTCDGDPSINVLDEDDRERLVAEEERS